MMTWKGMSNFDSLLGLGGGQFQSTPPVCSLICINNNIPLALFKNLSRQL